MSTAANLNQQRSHVEQAHVPPLAQASGPGLAAPPSGQVLAQEQSRSQHEQVQDKNTSAVLETAPIPQDVFLMIRRKKLTIFTDAKDTTTVLELKKIIEGILKVPPTNQQLFNKDNTVMEDDKMLQDYGLTSTTAKAQSPATVGLAVRDDNGLFEPLELTPYSAPPDLPDVMKSQESNGQEQSS